MRSGVVRTASALVMGVLAAAGCGESSSSGTEGAGVAGGSAGVAGADVGQAGTQVASNGGSGGSVSDAGSAGMGGDTADTPDASIPVDHNASGVIVVLGSSTAEGTGPSDPDNAWVRRYEAYLAQEFPNFAVTNLAIGGYTTYQIQPSDFSPPPDRPNPVPTNNITAALALNPDAIIINMPSNDQANNFPLGEQLENYNRVAALADAAGALLWVTTTQPRNFADEGQRMDLMAARDAITERFGEFTIDFWTTFAQDDGMIKPEYNSDGTHMNDEAHALLAHLVIAAEVPETVLRAGN